MHARNAEEVSSPAPRSLRQLSRGITAKQVVSIIHRTDISILVHFSGPILSELACKRPSLPKLGIVRRVILFSFVSLLPSPLFCVVIHATSPLKEREREGKCGGKSEEGRDEGARGPETVQFPPEFISICSCGQLKFSSAGQIRG